jgi:hypothetical protein
MIEDFRGGFGLVGDFWVVISAQRRLAIEALNQL